MQFSIAMAMPNAEPITTTKIIADSERPNQRMANGTQQMLGSVWMPRISGFKFPARYLECTMQIPSKMPMRIEIPKPVSTRSILPQTAESRVPFFSKRDRQASTPKGLGMA